MSRRRSRTALLCLSAVLFLAAPIPGLAQGLGAGPDPGTIRLKAGTFDPVAAMPSVPAALKIAKYESGVRGGYLVQFDGPISEADRAALEGVGAAIGPNKWRGMTPQAALHHISFDNGYSDRQMFERESEEGVHISSNSWGWSSGGNSIRDYNSNAAIWDEGVWDADNDVAGQQTLTVVFSADNDGGWNSPYAGCLSAGADNIGSPGTAKNVITVGNNETDRRLGGLLGPGLHRRHAQLLR